MIIAPANEYISPGTARASGLVVAATSPIRQAKDLNGKTIACTALHSVAETAPRAWIDENGGDSSLVVKFIEFPLP